MNLWYFTYETSKTLNPSIVKDFCSKHGYEFELCKEGWGITSSDFGIYGDHDWFNTHNPTIDEFNVDDDIKLSSLYYGKCEGDWVRVIGELDNEVANNKLELLDEGIDNIAMHGGFKYLEDEVIANRNSVNEIRERLGLSKIVYPKIDMSNPTPYSKIEHKPIVENTPNHNVDPLDIESMLFGD